MSDNLWPGEWREGWGLYYGLRCSWTSWGLGLNVSIGLGSRPNREWGVYLDVGPFFAFVSLERESQYYGDGKRTDLAVGRVA